MFNLEVLYLEFSTVIISSFFQCMFRLLPESNWYRRGRKQYNLNFLKTDEGR